MITVALSDVLNFLPALQRVMKEKMPVKAAYRLKRIATALDAELNTFEKQRIELYKELGEREGDQYVVKDPEKLKQLREQVNAMTEEKINIDLDPVTIDMLGDSQLQPSDLMALERIIV